ncbi:MAG: hypothetical protein HY369_01100 [Candidatus Aenigmarchaeota archaeon]|nr:hypothetical protein [Candidatus Aenigmarchaeota archaeon]
MKILVQGGGGREYALAQHFARHGHQVVGSPGNAAFHAMGIGDTHPYFDPQDFARYCEDGGFDLAVAGAEGPLRDGLGDVMHERHLPFFGPIRAHARAEWDKGYLHELLQGTGIMPKGRVFRSRIAARTYLQDHWKERQYVVKSTQLREGKGVYVPETLADARAAVDRIMYAPPAGWGDDVLLQQRLEGTEVSSMTIVGRGFGSYEDNTVTLASSKDNKPVGRNRFGLDPQMNTGGMGGESPHPTVSESDFSGLLRSHTIPLISAVEQDTGVNHMVGVVYNGLMYSRTVGGVPLVNGRFSLLESNLGRFGDPETEYVLPRLRSDLAKYLKAAVEGDLSGMPPLEWDPRVSATVFLCTPGYPTAEYKRHTGKPLRGIDLALHDPDAIVSFAGVGQNQSNRVRMGSSDLINTGGRVFALTVLGDTRDEAWDHLYGVVDGGRAIGIGDGPEDVHFRTDLKRSA